MHKHLKKLAVASAAAAMVAAMPAVASINTEDGAELFLVVVDEDNAGSYTLDTGIKLRDVLAGFNTPGYSFSVDVGPAYAQYTTADSDLFDSTASGTGTRWMLYAADTEGFQSVPGDIQLLTTATRGRAPTATGGNLNENIFSLAIYAGETNSTGTHGVLVADNGDSFNPKNSQGQFSEMSTVFGLTSLLSGNAIGTTTDLFFMTKAVEDDFVDVTGLSLGKARFDGSTISFAVAAIPEPSTYALMFAGLAAVGIAARRRRRG